MNDTNRVHHFVENGNLKKKTLLETCKFINIKTMIELCKLFSFKFNNLGVTLRYF